MIMKNTYSTNLKFRQMALILLGLLLSSCAAHVASTAEKGWLETAEFSRMLPNNEKTLEAGDRQEPQLRVHPISMPPTEITRNSTTTFALELDAVPLVASLQMSVWHLGTDQKPVVRVNGAPAGTLEPCFPSLAGRNYIFFYFPNRDGSKNIQMDYQGWLEAKCIFDGALLKKGTNQIELGVETDQIKIRDISVEALYELDSSDTVHDFTRPKASRSN